MSRIDNQQPRPRGQCLNKGAGRLHILHSLHGRSTVSQIYRQIVSQPFLIAQYQARDPCQINNLRAWKCGRHRIESKTHGKSRSFAQLALNRDLPPHQLSEMMTDRQTETRSAEAPRCGSVTLGKRGKQARLGFGTHADTVVDYLEFKHGLIVGSMHQKGAYRYVARFFLSAGKLDGIVGKIDQDLTQSQCISKNFLRDGGIKKQRKFHPFPCRQAFEHGARFLHHVTTDMGACSISRRPASILEKSRMSSMISSSAKADSRMRSTISI